jgi:putative transcriptional regulator
MSNGRKIIEGLEEAVKHARGGLVGVRERRVRVPNHVDVQAIRKRLGLTQQEFALKFGFSVGTVRNWEQGARAPDGAARVLLTVIEREPEAVMKALDAGFQEAC